ncbi:phosphatase PAP2 family protein [Modestobacter sp. L9-4]|uniref:phosphatase PAP2 family protein n=1 Tax=Modestobacter sp. L9-4 TaxID=2851567 RepID=UPI001C74F88F|nr:phosphatase PAP2 family protein [Modestobacter sp. L9-4]QXG75939.1 phosphatase PAP2 family protein [Modestobacter sp. L9-4]
MAIVRQAGTAHRHRWGICPVALRETALVLAMLFAYTRIRLVASDDRSVAEGHARDVLSVERWLHLDVESTLNRVLGALPPLEVAASYWYAALHYTVTPLALVLLYRSRPAEYRRLRTALVLATAVALIGYVTFPTAPPRLVGGYTDTLAATSSVGWWGAEGSAVRGAGGAVNQFAAMPSMHVGWALWCGLVFWRLARTRRQRALAAAYAPVTALVVVSTANHWVLDVVVGALLMTAAWVAVQPRTRRRTPAAVPGVRAVVPVPRSGTAPLPPAVATGGSGAADVSSAETPAGPR